MVPISDAKEKFLINELFILAWGASVQRNLIYKKTASQVRRRKFQEDLKVFVIEELMPRYHKRVSDSKHISNLLSLVKESERKGVSILRGGEYKFGIAQKLLNTFLKYIWTCNKIKEPPPHCPIDRIVLGKISHNPFSWTKMNTIDELKRYLCMCLLLSLWSCNFVRINKLAPLLEDLKSTNSINFQNLNVSVYYEELERVIPEDQKNLLIEKYTVITEEVSNNLKSKFIQDIKKNDKIQIKLSYQSEGKLLLGLKDIQPELQGSKIEIINMLNLGLLPSWLNLNLCATVIVNDRSDVICGKKLQVFHLPRALGMLSFFILMPLDILFAITVFPYEKRTPLSQQLLYYDSDFPGWMPDKELTTAHIDLLRGISTEIAKSIVEQQAKNTLN
ncbi:hypothetical protein EHQ81_12680 [Leptospira selangorensis]|uniref:Uncharacterized protein n=1 Tax=Leptospira selangorensis TaxID=2484982 RepID=A0A5F2C6Q3_9LEPT|nr:hypothetical protein [Leptospira selangorensis]TGM12741.1 hypothetical protein EHQ81_12680 [Leptospira selangorensis]TGM30802.1 hypothetical protein EHQ82_00520 [Leptospira selangorensis]